MSRKVGNAELHTRESRRDVLRYLFLQKLPVVAPEPFVELQHLYDTHFLAFMTIRRARIGAEEVPERGLQRWLDAVLILSRDAPFGAHVHWEEAATLARGVPVSDRLSQTTGEALQQLFRGPVEATTTWAHRWALEEDWFLRVVWMNLASFWPAGPAAMFHERLHAWRAENHSLSRHEVLEQLARVGSLTWDPTRENWEEFTRQRLPAYKLHVEEAFTSTWPELLARPKKEHEHVHWFIDYQVRGRSWRQIAAAAGRLVPWTTVRSAVRRLSDAMEFPLRPGVPGRPKRHAAKLAATHEGSNSDSLKASTK